MNGRADGFRALVRLLAAHETAEQTLVYPALRAMGGEGNKVADARMAEEEAAKDAIDAMEALEPASAQFAMAFIGFRGDVESHAAHEESEVLPLLSTHLTDEDGRRMAEAFRAVEEMAPTPDEGATPAGSVSSVLADSFVTVAKEAKDVIDRTMN